jgi:nucleoid-associated protein YgaU
MVTGLVTCWRWLDSRYAVTPIKKIFLAAAFVAAGYGIASQLGAPILKTRGRSEQLADAPTPATAQGQQTALLNSVPDARPHLVPEVQSGLPNIFDRDIEAAREPIGGDSQSAFELASVAAPPLALLANAEAAGSAGNRVFAPRAALRNEAPRPLLVEPRTPASIKDVPVPFANSIDSAHDSGAPGAPAVSSPSTVLQAQFSNDAAIGTTDSTAQSISSRAMLYLDSNPMPLGQIAESDPSRSHIIVDGDSLAKLAERYLDDPQRANEIYELNRALLSHPDVLPIGAEIAIPMRSAGALQSSNDSPQSLYSGPAAIHAASRGGLVPVRPIPIGTSVMPRAQLARPMLAEQ